MKAGAAGYVCKGDMQQDLFAAIAAVQQGRTWLSPSVCCNGNRNDNKATAGITDACSWEQLTMRERQILKFVAEGKKNSDIASCLSISRKTVEKHRTHLMNKLEPIS